MLDFATAVCTVRTFFSCKQYTLPSKNIIDLFGRHKAQNVKGAKITTATTRSKRGIGINGYLHMTTPQRASAHEAKQLQCGARSAYRDSTYGIGKIRACSTCLLN